MKMFSREKDFQAFETLIAEAQERHPMRILSYCLMGTHWHFVVRPKRDGELTSFFRWLSHTHAMRWRVSHRTVGDGHLYQGRFKSFPVQPEGASLRAVCRYVERNALSAGLVERAQDWRWGSLWVRRQGTVEQRGILSEWPEPVPANWIERVNRPIHARERERMKVSLERCRPFGEDDWVVRTAGKLGMEHTMRREGRPVKAASNNDKGKRK